MVSQISLSEIIFVPPFDYEGQSEAFLHCSHNEKQSSQKLKPSDKALQKGEVMFPMKTKQTKEYKEKHSFRWLSGFWALDIIWPSEFIRPTVMTALNRSFVGFHHDS